MSLSPKKVSKVKAFNADSSFSIEGMDNRRLNIFGLLCLRRSLPLDTFWIADVLECKKLLIY
jgi:hypothetical protein